MISTGLFSTPLFTRGFSGTIVNLKASNAFEAITLTSEGKISDGITSNIYLVQDSTVLTPSAESGILEGITRAVVDMGMRWGRSPDRHHGVESTKLWFFVCRPPFPLQTVGVLCACSYSHAFHHQLASALSPSHPASVANLLHPVYSWIVPTRLGTGLRKSLASDYLTAVT